MATSFISERSAELAVVPFLKSELEGHFLYVAPVFPWLNRETSKISDQVHANDQFKVLALFPRRPKLDKENREYLYVTINRELALYRKLADEYSVPVIAGCPIAANFWELSRCKNFVFFEITNELVDCYLNPVSRNPANDPAGSASITSVTSQK